MDKISQGDEICVLCCRETAFFAVGSCDHHVCYECSTRMRVLCQQNECPICRSDMPLVIFSKMKLPFSSTYDYEFHEKKYMIVFESENIQAAFYKLLEHKCPECKRICESFKVLEKHVRREHSLNYCLVCAENLKLFTFERRCYNRKDLAYHNRKGDLDDKSHRGHPECESCQKRFMDRDELFRHMRKEHFFCHFCDADLIYKFYEEYEDLRNHFRADHFLCEEETCARERFVSVFRTDIDLKAHKATKHMKNKTKAELKQTRTLDVGFTLPPRHIPMGELSPNEFRRGRNQNNRRKINQEDVSRNMCTSPTEQSNKPFNAVVEDFPLLSNEGQSPPKNLDTKSYENRYSSCVSSAFYKQPLPIHQKVMKGKHKQICTEDFPALSGSTSKSSQNYSGDRPMKTNVSNHRTFSQHIQNSLDSRKNKKIESSKWGQNKKPLNMNDFPELESSDHFHIENSQTQHSEPVKLEKPTKPKDESLAQLLSAKCKTQSQNARELEMKNHFSPNYTKQNHRELENTIPLPSMYGGLGKLNPLDYAEEKDPMEEKVEEIMRQNRAYRYRDISEEETPWHEPVQLDLVDDFPPLESNNLKEPPGFNKSWPCKPNNSVSRASPPGFSKSSKPVINNNSYISLSSIAQQLNDSKLKSSQSNMESKLNPVLFTYQKPVNFQERNNNLIYQIKELIGSNNKLFDEFKMLSGNFRTNKISASDYYSNCLRILGKDKFLQLFSELLCLLPDIPKQQELSYVHEQLSKEDSKPRGAVPKKYNIQSYIRCPICLQVLAKPDLTNHQLLHGNEVNYFMR